jgi:hypothetical protein
MSRPRVRRTVGENPAACSVSLNSAIVVRDEPS